MLSPLTSAHCAKIVTVHQNVALQAFMEEVARRSHASGKPSRLQNLGIMSSPTLGSIQRPVPRLSQFPAHVWMLCLGGPRLATGRRRRGLHQRRSGLDSCQRWRSRRVFKVKNVFLTRDTEKNPKSFQRRCCREVRLDPFLWRTCVHTRRER